MKDNKIYLKIQGNCGNQFFQYAFARTLQEKFGGEMIIDYSEVASDPLQASISDNLLSEFNTVDYEYVTDNSKNPHKILTKLHDKLADLIGLKAYTVPTYKYCLFWARHFERFGVYYFSAAFFPFKYKWNKDFFINGYFESPEYFQSIDDKICDELSPKKDVLPQNKDLFDIIQSRESVCISIKRQDVENSDISAVYAYDINYFYNAINYIRKKISNPVWVIFSDNPKWCKENFIVDGEVYYENEDNPIWEKIRLMSSCKHFIIHNSTFSWWVQHLSRNKDKIVIAPIKWMLRDDQPIDIYEKHFTYMDNSGKIHATHY